MLSFLREMYNYIRGKYRINDYNSNDFILFKFLNLGHVNIFGQVGESFNSQYFNLTNVKYRQTNFSSFFVNFHIEDSVSTFRRITA